MQQEIRGNPLHAPRLGASRKLAIGGGDFGLNFYWQTAGLYLLYFYTDVMRLPPAVGGAIYMAALIWDALLDPLIGLLADRTRSRFGRYRPWILFGAPVLGLASILLFVVPTSLGWWTVLLVGATHFLFRTLYACVSVPYAALTARVTRDAAARADITGVRIVAATMAGLIVAMLTLPLAAAFGGGRAGWSCVGASYAAVATVVLILCARGVGPLDSTAGDERQPAVPLTDKLRSTASNWPLMLVLGAVATSSFTSTIFQKSLLYYFKYALGNASLGGAALGFCAVVSGVCVPAFALLARRHGKRVTWMTAAVPTITGLVAWHLADGHGTVALFAALGTISVGSAGYYVSFWAMLPDTVEFGEWKTGARAESFAFGLAMLGQKAALGLGAGLLGILLAQIGYRADMAQTAATLAGLKTMMFWLPLTGAIVAAPLIAFYPISPRHHREIVREIGRRQAIA